MKKHILLGVVVCLFTSIFHAKDPLQLEVDRAIPAEVLLDMIGESSQLSSWQRVGVKFWLRFNGDAVKRVMKHVDQPESFNDLKKDFLQGMAREGVTSDVESAIQGVLDSIEKDPELVCHVNDHLRSGNRLHDEERNNIFMRCHESVKDFNDCNKAKLRYSAALRNHANEYHKAFVDRVTENFIHN